MMESRLGLTETPAAGGRHTGPGAPDIAVGLRTTRQLRR